MDGLGYGYKELNFANGAGGFAAGNMDVKQIFNRMLKGNGQKSFMSLKGPLDVVEKLILRLVAVTIMGTVMYCAFSTATMKQITSKTEEVNSALSSAQSQISKINSDYSTISSRTSYYTSLINSVNNLSESTDEAVATRVITKDSIPNLLNRIMFVIPQKVLITSIKNSQSDHIVIEAQSEKYEQLGYFKAVLDSKGILKNVKSTSGTKDSGVVKVTIEGDLP
jgi:Tfp pilus assembly protein PilN